MNQNVGLTPESVASELRRIADRIDNSSSPSVRLVAAEIVRLARSVSEAATPMPGRIRKMRPATTTADVSDDSEYSGAMKRLASSKKR